jgi:DNA polymerase III epsilon subunit-like protein
MIKIVCDIESTGFKHWWHDLISIGLVALDETNNVTGTFYGTCRPWWGEIEHFNPDSTKAHGFTFSDSMTFQEPRKLAISVLNFLAPFRTPGQYSTFINHSLSDFDFFFVQSFFYKCELQFSFYKMFNHSKCVDTIRLARDAGHQGNSLSQWASRLNQSFNHHNALDDALMCARVYKFLKESQNVESNVEQTPTIHGKRGVQVSERPERVANCGELKGIQNKGFKFHL